MDSGSHSRSGQLLRSQTPSPAPVPQSVASSQLWTVQRRSIQRLPDHAATKLFSMLLHRRAVDAAHLAHFAGSVTVARVQASPGWQPGGEWAQHLARFKCVARRCMLLLPGLLPAQHQQHPAARASLCRYLEELQLEGLAKLKDKDLAPLAGLAGLEQLSLRACKQLTSKALPCLAGLTRLRRLDLTGRRRPLCTTTGLDLVRAARGATGHASSSLQRCHGPRLACPSPSPGADTSMGPGFCCQLTGLAALTSLSLGGQPTDDEGLAALAQQLPALCRLSIWGSQVSDAAVAILADLQQLSSLDLSWTPVQVLPVFPNMQVSRTAGTRVVFCGPQRRAAGSGLLVSRAGVCTAAGRPADLPAGAAHGALHPGGRLAQQRAAAGAAEGAGPGPRAHRGQGPGGGHHQVGGCCC